MRTMKASTKTPTVRAVAIGLMMPELPSGMNIAKTLSMMSAAVLTTGAALRKPLWMACTGSPLWTYSSAVRETRKTS